MSNMKAFLKNRTDVAQYVFDQLGDLSRNSQLTMTMKPLKLGAYCVHTAIATESEDTDEVICPYCSLLFHTSTENIPDGQSLPK